MTLDQYHYQLLRSKTQQDRADGLLSTVYWGYYANSGGGPTGYSEARASWIANGKVGKPGNSTASSAAAVSNAVAALKMADISGALHTLLSLRYIRMSFASKLLMFMAPRQCVVLDKVIAERLQTSGNATLRSIGMSAEGYLGWCAICREAAKLANKSGSRWADWDKSTHPWRAVDVERAVFGYSKDPKDFFASVTVKRIVTAIVK